MKVRCINVGKDSLLLADTAAGNTRSSDFHVYLGREYQVYGLLFFQGVIDFLIVDETGWPSWKPASLFKIICGRPSRHWRFYNWSTSLYFGVMSFPELVGTIDLYDQLALGEDEARAKFFNLKEKADLEFVDDSITATADYLQDDWLQCPSCADAWQASHLDAMVKCPKCHKVFRNPKFLIQE